MPWVDRGRRVARLSCHGRKRAARIDHACLEILNAVPDAITNVLGAMQVAGVRGLRHPDTHESRRNRVRREFQCDCAALAVLHHTARKRLPLPVGRAAERRPSHPIVDLVHLGVRIRPADLDRVERLLGAQVHHHPLRVERVAFTGELAGQVRMTFPMAAVRALDRAVATGREAAVWQGIAQDVAQRFLEFAARGEIATLAGRIAPGSVFASSATPPCEVRCCCGR